MGLKLVSSSASTNQAVPSAYYDYKQRVEADGGEIVDDQYTADCFRLLSLWGITTGVVVSPSFGVRKRDGVLDRFYGLLGNDISDPYKPRTNIGEFPLAEYENVDSVLYDVSNAPHAIPESADAFAVTDSMVMAVAARSSNSNTALEGYLIALTGNRRFSIFNNPISGNSRINVDTGYSQQADAFGDEKPALAEWKVSLLYADSVNLKAIEDSIVKSTVPTSGFFIPEPDYRARIGVNATGSGGYNLRPQEVWFADAWVLPDASEEFAMALAQFLADKYETP